MRSIGETSSLETHVFEMLAVGARLKAHPHAKIKTIGEATLQKHASLRQLWFESITLEEFLIIATADLHVRDLIRDKTLVQLGGYLRTFASHLSEQIFTEMPSVIARLSYDKESEEIRKITSRLETLPAEEPVREAYAERLRQEEADFQASKHSLEEVESKQAALRLRILQAKIDADSFRFQRFAECATHLPKSDSESLFEFRPKASSKPEPQKIVDKPAETPTLPPPSPSTPS